MLSARVGQYFKWVGQSPESGRPWPAWPRPRTATAPKVIGTTPLLMTLSNSHGIILTAIYQEITAHMILAEVR